MAEVFKIEALIDKVLAGSKSRKILWTETPDKDVYSFVLQDGKYILKSFSFTQESGDNKPSLGIFSNDNKMLVDIIGESFAKAAKLKQIYELAKDRASGADEAIDQVLAALDFPADPE